MSFTNSTLEPTLTWFESNCTRCKKHSGLVQSNWGLVLYYANHQSDLHGLMSSFVENIDFVLSVASG